jgi:hypothetical protein
VYLFKLDIFVGSVDPELYNDCVRTIDSKENVISVSDAAVMMDWNTEAAIDNFQLEVIVADIPFLAAVIGHLNTVEWLFTLTPALLTAGFSKCFLWEYFAPCFQDNESCLYRP